MEGYWKATRRLRRLLEDGELTVTAYGLLHYLAEAGADRDQGMSTTYAELARLFEVSEKTISRAMARLRSLDLLAFEIKQGQRRPFRVHLGPQLGHKDGGSLSDATSDVTSDTSPTEGSRNRASTTEEGPDTTSDRLRPKPSPTKTKTKKDKTNAEFLAAVFDAYLGAGGSLELEQWRGALARQATALARTGAEHGLVLAAAAQLGRERAFPGYLKQRTEALEATGGACAWDGLDRSRLSPTQLAECTCRRCAEWCEFVLAEASQT